jgi:hypothetical protein
LTKEYVVGNCAPVLVASVAQLVEQLTLNQLVAGSSPARGTSLCPLGYDSAGQLQILPQRIFLSCFARLAINEATEITAIEFFPWSNF